MVVMGWRSRNTDSLYWYLGVRKGRGIGRNREERVQPRNSVMRIIGQNEYTDRGRHIHNRLGDIL